MQTQIFMSKSSVKAELGFLNMESMCAQTPLPGLLVHRVTTSLGCHV